MADLQAGETFIDGENVTAARLMDHVQNAIILPAFITSRPNVAPAGGDLVPFYQSAQSRIARATITSILALTPTNAVAATPSLRKLGTGATDAAAGNDTRFPAVIDGIRRGNGASDDTVAVAQDFAEAATNISGTVVNWALNNVFWKILTVNTTLTFSNVKNGQVIIMGIQRASHTLTLPTLTGDVPVPAAGSTVDIYTVAKIGNWLVASVKSV